MPKPVEKLVEEIENDIAKDETVLDNVTVEEAVDKVENLDPSLKEMKEDEEKKSMDKDSDDDDDDDEDVKKKKMDEHLSILFADEKLSELSEETKIKLSAIFEAAVKDVSSKVIASTKAKYTSKLNEEITKLDEANTAKLEEFKTEFTKKSDSYCEFVAKKWLEENKSTVENNVKVEVSESFLHGLKQLFEEHYVEIPDDKVNVFEELTKTIATLEEENEKAISENFELKEEIKSVERKHTVDKIAENLSFEDKERFMALTESFDSDEGDFVKKLEAVKEAYFTNEVINGLELDENFDIVIEPAKKGPASLNDSVSMTAHYLNRSRKN